MVKYFVFDFDGTLVNSRDVIVNAYNLLTEKYGTKKVEPKDFDPLMALPIIERCKAVNFKLFMFPFMAMDIYKLYRESIKDVHFFEGIRELLEELKLRGFEIAIISTNSESIIRDFLHRNDIDFINDVICSGNLHGKAKDINKLLRKRGLKKDEIIYVGDESRDIAASRKTGVRVIWVSWGYDHINNVAKLMPDYTANAPDEILKISALLN